MPHSWAMLRRGSWHVTLLVISFMSTDAHVQPSALPSNVWTLHASTPLRTPLPAMMASPLRFRERLGAAWGNALGSSGSGTVPEEEETPAVLSDEICLVPGRPGARSSKSNLIWVYASTPKGRACSF